MYTVNVHHLLLEMFFRTITEEMLDIMDPRDSSRNSYVRPLPTVHFSLYYLYLV